MAKLRDLIKGPKVRKPFTYARRDANGTETQVHVILCPLAHTDLDAARGHATAFIAALQPKIEDDDLRGEAIADALAIELLARAVRDPDQADAAWATPEELRSMLPVLEVSRLYGAWKTVQTEASPEVGSLTPDAFRATVNALAKEASELPLALFGSALRVNFIHSMAKALSSSLTDKSSPSSPSSSRTETSADEPSPDAEEGSPS